MPRPRCSTRSRSPRLDRSSRRSIGRAVMAPGVDFERSGRRSRRAPHDHGGFDTVSAEELRAKIREVPDFPKPGILFYDITTLLKDAAAYREAIDLMLAPYAGEAIDIVVGMESRGFIFSAP